MTESEYHHTPVLVTEVVALLQVQEGSHYLDCTCGGGGHSSALLAFQPNIYLTLIDQDASAIAACQGKFQGLSDRVTYWQGNFSEYVPQSQFAGIIADLGVSSQQLDDIQRGFSWRGEGKLDMRMDQQQALTAEVVVNQWSERQLAQLIYDYGEERLSRPIARAIVQARPITTTKELAEVIWQAVPPSYRYGKIHPATRTFQAIRICVNRELEVLQTWLTQMPDWLQDGGRVAVISFHSLEDRLVKQAMRHDPRLEVITKKPIIPSPAEIALNPRARSAKLRIAQRIPRNHA